MFAQGQLQQQLVRQKLGRGGGQTENMNQCCENLQKQCQTEQDNSSKSKKVQKKGKDSSFNGFL